MNNKYIQEQEELIANVKNTLKRLDFDSNESNQDNNIMSLKEKQMLLKNKHKFFYNIIFILILLASLSLFQYLFSFFIK